MINWDLLAPRNLIVIVIFIVITLSIYKHFSGGVDSDTSK